MQKEMLWRKEETGNTDNLQKGEWCENQIIKARFSALLVL